MKWKDSDTRNVKKVWIGSGRGRRSIKVDQLMANLIGIINHTSLKTLGCCSGHGKYPMTIIVRQLNGDIIDLVSGRQIPRKKRFYVKDNEGFYFIPETLEK